jgi:O-antigen ligase
VLAYAVFNEGGAHGTYVNRNHFAGLMELALPFALMGAQKHRWLWIPAGAIFAGIVCSFSRGGFLAMLFSLSLMGVLLAGRQWSGRRKTIAISPILIGAFVAFVYLPPDPFFSRFADASEAEISTLNGRLLFLQDSPPLIARYAAFGCGLGAFESAFYAVKNILPNDTIDFAHNDYVQGFIELGAVGFAIVAILIVGVLNRAVRATEGDHRFFAVACIGSLSAILMHSLVDFNLYIPANALVAAWICGLSCVFVGGR